MNERTRRRPVAPPPGTVRHFPTAPGWWVQWHGRSDWRPITEAAGVFLRQVIAADGDRVVRIDDEGSVKP